MVKNLPANARDSGDTGSIPVSRRLLEKGTATHSNILAWEIPWTEEPGRLQSMGSRRVGHDWVTEHNLCICMHTHYTFFIHLSIHGHSGCLHVLTMNIGVHLSFLISAFVFFGSIPKCGVTGLYGSSVFNFLKDLHTVFLVAIPVYVPTSSAWGFLFPHFLANTLSDKCEMIPHLVLIYIFWMISDAEHLFIFLFALFLIIHVLLFLAVLGLCCCR